MPTLKQYRERIVSVKSTRKITSAMKMVAASKLKRAQDQAEASQPYAEAMGEMLARVAASVQGGAGPKLLVGSGNDQKHLFIVVTSDRGLAGGFNSNVARFARNEMRQLIKAGKDVKIITVGRKARDILKRDFGSNIVDSITGLGGKEKLNFTDAAKIAEAIAADFNAGGFDVATLVYNHFQSVLTQTPKTQQLIPFAIPTSAGANENKKKSKVVEVPKEIVTSPYSFEPSEEEILAQLLPKNLAIQIFRALLDSAAGEHAARMTAMDSATRNAGDMIKKLSQQYNRARQATITKELIEIISGAEAI